eukprot:g7937.t1
MSTEDEMSGQHLHQEELADLAARLRAKEEELARSERLRTNLKTATEQLQRRLRDLGTENKKLQEEKSALLQQDQENKNSAAVAGATISIPLAASSSSPGSIATREDIEFERVALERQLAEQNEAFSGRLAKIVAEKKEEVDAKNEVITNLQELVQQMGRERDLEGAKHKQKLELELKQEQALREGAAVKFEKQLQQEREKFGEKLREKEEMLANLEAEFGKIEGEMSMRSAEFATEQVERNRKLEKMLAEEREKAADLEEELEGVREKFSAEKEEVLVRGKVQGIAEAEKAAKEELEAKLSERDGEWEGKMANRVSDLEKSLKSGFEEEKAALQSQCDAAVADTQRHHEAELNILQKQLSEQETAATNAKASAEKAAEKHQKELAEVKLSAQTEIALLESKLEEAAEEIQKAKNELSRRPHSTEDGLEKLENDLTEILSFQQSAQRDLHRLQTAQDSILSLESQVSKVTEERDFMTRRFNEVASEKELLSEIKNDSFGKREDLLVELQMIREENKRLQSRLPCLEFFEPLRLADLSSEEHELKDLRAVKTQLKVHNESLVAELARLRQTNAALCMQLFEPESVGLPDGGGRSYMKNNPSRSPDGDEEAALILHGQRSMDETDAETSQIRQLATIARLQQKLITSEHDFLEEKQRLFDRIRELEMVRGRGPPPSEKQELLLSGEDFVEVKIVVRKRPPAGFCLKTGQAQSDTGTTSSLSAVLKKVVWGHGILNKIAKKKVVQNDVLQYWEYEFGNIKLRDAARAQKQSREGVLSSFKNEADFEQLKYLFGEDHEIKTSVLVAGCSEGDLLDFFVNRLSSSGSESGSTSASKPGISASETRPEIHGFEVLASTYGRLEEKYANASNVFVHHLGWGDINMKEGMELEVTGFGEMSGLYASGGQFVNGLYHTKKSMAADLAVQGRETSRKPRRDFTVHNKVRVVALADWVRARSSLKSSLSGAMNKARAIDYVVIDVEGFEPKVLRGMQLEDEENRRRFPLFQLELGPSWAERDARHHGVTTTGGQSANETQWTQEYMAKTLEGYGYQLFLIGMSGYLQVSPFFFSPLHRHTADDGGGPFVWGNLLAMHKQYADEHLQKKIYRSAAKTAERIVELLGGGWKNVTSVIDGTPYGAD